MGLGFQLFVTVLREMGDKIKSQMTELRKHQEHLVELVKERTSDLEGKTIELEGDRRRKRGSQEKGGAANTIWLLVNVFRDGLLYPQGMSKACY